MYVGTCGCSFAFLRTMHVVLLHTVPKRTAPSDISVDSFLPGRHVHERMRLYAGIYSSSCYAFLRNEVEEAFLFEETEDFEPDTSLRTLSKPCCVFIEVT